MRFQCKCGHVFSTTTDPVPDQHHLLSDHDWLELIESESGPSILTRELRKRFRTAFECNDCGRFWVADKDRKRFHSFMPEDPSQPRISN